MTRVLIVDDREENRYFLQVLLEGNGFEVDIATQGAEALERARETLPDLVISDLLMPVMDGYTLLRQWKADAQLSAVPFMIYTATYTEDDDEALAMSLGADAFIVKPADTSELLGRIRALQGGASAAAPSTPRRPGGREEELLKAYNQVLIRKLEQKMLQLEVANDSLRRDVIERTRAKERLEQSAMLLRIAGQAARLGGWTLNLKDDLLTWSDETCAIHDLPPGCTPKLQEAIQFYLPEHRSEIIRHVDACATHGEPYDLELQLITARGRKIWIRTIGEAARDEKGRIVGIQGAFQDISERRQLEQRILRSQRMESIATLTGGMAHDLNNVLAPIILSVPLLRDEIDDADTLDILDTVESCAQRGADMVKQVLSFARGIEGARATLDIARILEDLRTMIRGIFPRSIEIHSAVSDDLWSVEGDPTQIHQVFMNLFVNARDAMSDGGQLTVVAENMEVDTHYAAMSGDASPGPHVRISVIDSGCGMSPDILDQIFEPLFTTKPAGKGTGLGLPNMAAIVESHGGFVSVYSEEGSGSTFRIHFPATLEERHMAAIAPTGEVWVGNQELILVVDDEAAVRSIARQTLEAFGYRVVTAVDGADAMEIFQENSGEIALVLTDIVMPTMDGPALVQALMKMNASARIVAASGVGMNGGVSRATAAGVRHFLAKPYTAESLLTVIHEALNESAQGPAGTETPEAAGAE